MAETTVNLDQFETKAAFELEARGVGTTIRQMMIRGNAVLSSVYIKSIAAGATLKVNYFDTTSGDNSTGERFDLTSHALLTDANVGQTVRMLVPRIHNKPQIEAIVTGGAIEFGVYVTVVADFPVDITTPPGGLPVTIVDDGVEAADGAPLQFGTADGLQTTSATEIELIDETVPVGKVWRLRQVLVSCRAPGKFRVLLDGVMIGQGTTGPASENPRFSWVPYLAALAGEQIVVKFAQTVGPAMDISGFLQVTELDA